MQNFHELMREVLSHGQYKPNRTGVGTYAVVGRMLKYDTRAGFPAITTKKLFFGAVKGELLGFFRGFTSAAQFQSLGVKIWDQNANETAAWVANPNRQGHNDLGRIYGAQWTDWKDWRVVTSQDAADQLFADGYELISKDPNSGNWVFRKGINQLELALHTLLTNPFDRGITITGWRLDEFDRMALRPCHAEYRFVCMPDKTLEMTLAIRSNDLFLGHAFNACSAALFLEIMARLAGLKAGTVTVFITDAHVYENHIDQVQEQLLRDHLAAPRLVLSERIRAIEDISQIKGVFEKIEPEDISLQGYTSHPAIPAPMAA